jgi:hypothetical protein
MEHLILLSKNELVGLDHLGGVNVIELRVLNVLVGSFTAAAERDRTAADRGR